MSHTGMRYRRGLIGAVGLLVGSSVAAADPAAATVPEADSLVAALKQGTAYGQLRPRYEFVDQEGVDEEAHAFTLRTRLGYQTAGWQRFSAVLEFEDVRAFGDEKFNSTVNGHTRYPIVLDPESTEVNQAYIDYAGLAETKVRLGRQYILLDNERFVGPVGWRQNSVSMDSVSLTNTALPDTKAFYAYVDNVNRLFGEDHPTQSDWDMSSHLVNVAYSGLRFADLVGYGYFLDFEDPASEALSTRTLGVRLDGAHALADDLKLLYTAEYADQRDHADGRPGDADYYWLTLGVDFKGLTVKLNQERLGGDGTYSFSTPLATVHAHNGWADKFLATPVDGLVDTSLEFGGSLAGFKLAAIFHDFQSDHDNYDYGQEWNLLAVRPINKHLKVAAKYADYSGDGNATNLARNAALGSDVQKFWLMADFTF
ncbi:MAG: alginate export family protein [Thiohalobacteraceae bacterium]